MATNLDCNEVRVGTTGHIWSAPLGTAMPTDVVTPMPAPWVDLGYTTEDGVSFSEDSNREDFNVWQSNTPCRSVITSQTLTGTFTLVQRNPDTIKLAFGGGTITTTTGVTIYKPPPAGINEVALVVEVIDGAITDRWCFYRGNPALNGDVQFTKSDMTGFPIEVTFLNTAAGLFELITNDPNMATGTTLEGEEPSSDYTATNEPAPEVAA